MKLRLILARTHPDDTRYTRTIPSILLLIILAFGTIASVAVAATQTITESRESVLDGTAFAEAQTLFYNGHYEAAAALAQTLIQTDPDNLQLYELRSSALLFQIKRAIGDPPDKEKALKHGSSSKGVRATMTPSSSSANWI